MAETTLATASQKEVFRNDYLTETTRISRYEPYMGADENAVITTKFDLMDEAGKTINIPYFRRLRSTGVYNDGVLSGNEEAIANYNFPVSLQYVRNGVVVPKSQQYMTEIDMMQAGRKLLRVWGGENLRDWITLVGMSAAHVSGVNYPMVPIYDVFGNTVRAAASEANKDAWLVANSDRILFGKLVSNGSSLDHSTALANIDNTDDKLTPALGRLAKELAVTASNYRIRPTRVDDDLGREYFIMFCGSRSFRDISGSTEMQSANRDARSREAMDKNPIFQAGDLFLDGIIYREVPEITTMLTTSSAFSAAGNGGISVEPNFLCGAQACAVAWGEKPTIITDRDQDYKFRPGVAHQELRGVEKLAFNGVQTGMVTVYTAGVASA